MDTALELTLQMVITVLAGIAAQVLGDVLKIPSIVFLLLFGLLLGTDGLGVLHPSWLGAGLEVIVSLSVALILFEGGLNLELQEMGKVSGSLRNLVTFGTLITLLGGGMAAHWLGEFPWTIAFLYASLVVVTGPTVVSPMLKQISVDRRVATLLEGEGVLIDPVGAILAVVVLDVILNGGAEPLTVLSGLLLRLGIGGGIGAVGGWLLGMGLRRSAFLSDDLKNLVVLAGVWGLFGLAQSIRSEAGLMSTVVAGLVVGAFALPEQRLLRRFKGQLTTLAVSVLFVLLAADLSIASVFALGSGALLTVAVLMFVVRPIGVWLCTWNSDLNWRQKLFICWVAPRGIVSASVASLFAILLTEHGINGGDSIKALVFLTILSTVFVQGLSARWVARWLKITSQEATGAVIVGCSPLSVLVARLFRDRGEAAVLIDTDAAACQIAEQEGFPVLTSSALDAIVLEAAGLETAGTFLAMTHNTEVNLVLAQRAAEEFNPPRIFAVLASETPPIAPAGNATSSATSNATGDLASDLASPPTRLIATTTSIAPTSKIQPAFMPQVSLKTWNSYLLNKSVKLGETTLKEPEFLFQQAHLQALMRTGELVPLLMERDDRLQIVSGMDEWQAGDRLIYLLHDPRPLLLRQLSGSSSNALSLAKLPRVEELPIAALSLEVGE